MESEVWVMGSHWPRLGLQCVTRNQNEELRWGAQQVPYCLHDVYAGKMAPWADRELLVLPQLPSMGSRGESLQDAPLCFWSSGTVDFWSQLANPEATLLE